MISIEDVRFYYHSGVDIKRLVGAFISNLMNNSVQGGSTLTQQLVKNSLLSTERTYKRKIQEAYLAMQLEQEYSKDQILKRSQHRQLRRVQLRGESRRAGLFRQGSFTAFAARMRDAGRHHAVPV